MSDDLRVMPRGRSALSWGADLTPADELDEVRKDFLEVRENCVSSYQGSIVTRALIGAEREVISSL